ncbi:MAG: Holliday junction resolvase RuvX [Gammaproteobacteria bacterium]|nr:Holliday junction resolvase RuvX [Gammaproteobacteria bacterium]
MRTLLGFDFGLQRIGVAVGQEITGTATALRTVTAVDGKPDWKTLSELVQTWQPDALVVGLPLHADASVAGITQAVKRFIRQLEGRFHLPVYCMDERLSSQAAGDLRGHHQQELAGKGLDAVAARIILQDWLETHNGNA